MFFYVRGNDADSEINVVRLDGHEEYCTICPDCGNEINLGLEEFYGIAGEDVYGTQIICETCTKRRKRLHALD